MMLFVLIGSLIESWEIDVVSLLVSWLDIDRCLCWPVHCGAKVLAKNSVRMVKR